MSSPRMRRGNLLSSKKWVNLKQELKGKDGEKMTLTQKRTITLAVVILAGIVLGRLAVRAVLNLMLGGSMFGGNFL